MTTPVMHACVVALPHEPMFTGQDSYLRRG